MNTDTPTQNSASAADTSTLVYLSSVEVNNFKRIDHVSITLNKITYLVGGNNSGKSSVLQAIHTAFSCARLSLERGTKTKKKDSHYRIEPAKVLPESELLYRPTADFVRLGHNGPYQSKSKYAGRVKFSAALENGNIVSEFTISIYKANNHNNAGVDLQGSADTVFRNAISDKSTLFSVYVPGLTGIPLYEEYKSLGVILRTAAGGEANLVFRNILYHLKTQSRITELQELLEQIIGKSATFIIDFNEQEHQYINVKLSLDGEEAIPVDLWGTGVLQVTQVLAYGLLFRPKLFLIDEPDSHLHPSWQNTMAATFDEIAQLLGCRIVITTHSRHMITASPEGTRVVWMKDGRVADSDARELSEVLLDLEALDSFDRDAKIIVYTEDEKDSSLKQCLDGIPISRHISLIPYNGLKNAPKVKQINSLMHILNKDATIIIHRDRDCMTDEELATWAEPYENAGMVTFVPRMSDTESYYCTPEYLAAALKVSEQEARAIIDKCIQDNMQDLRDKFDSKRAEANILYHSRDGRSPISDDLWDEWNQDGSMRHVYGKELLKAIKQHTKTYSTRQRVGKLASSRLAQEFQVLLNSISRD